MVGAYIHVISISGDTNPDVRQKVISMSNWMLKQLQGLGVQAEPVSLGKQTIDGKPSDLDLPPVILGKLGTDPNKKTVLVYGHLDVQPVCQKHDPKDSTEYILKVNQEGWKTDPWVLNVDQDGRMTARGSTDDKGPCLGWLNVIEAHKALGLDLPVNMRFCFEAMEESGSEGLEDLIVKEAAKGNQGYFDNVDCMCIVSPGGKIPTRG